MKALVAYYTYSGKTELVAKEMGKILNAPTYKIEELKKRSSFNAFTLGCFASLMEKGSKIKEVSVKMDSFDTIFIGSPLWAWKVAPAVNSFIKEVNLKGKNVIPFVTMGGDKGEKAILRVSELINAQGGSVKGSFAIRTTGTDEEILKLAREQLSRFK